MIKTFVRHRAFTLATRSAPTPAAGLKAPPATLLAVFLARAVFLSITSRPTIMPPRLLTIAFPPGLPMLFRALPPFASTLPAPSAASRLGTAVVTRFSARGRSVWPGR